MPTDSTATARKIFWGIVLLLLGWAAWLASGAFFGGQRLAPDLRRAAIVVGAFAAFLGFWFWLLFYRQWRLSRPLPDDDDAGDEEAGDDETDE